MKLYIIFLESFYHINNSWHWAEIRMNQKSGQVKNFTCPCQRLVESFPLTIHVTGQKSEEGKVSNSK